MAKTKDKPKAVEPASEPEVIEGEAEEVVDEAQAAHDAAESVLEQVTEEGVDHSLDLVRREEAERVTVHPATMPTPREWEAMRAMAETISMTPFVPAAFRGKPESVLAAILTGREIGLGPMHSLKQIHIIEGKPAPSAELLLALIRKGGVRIEASESTDKLAHIVAVRTDTGERMDVSWTIEEAARANLTGKDNFKKYPADMLWARCVGRLARRLGGDLTGGFSYAAEEVSDFDNDYDNAEYSSGAIREPVRKETSGTPINASKSWADWIERFGDLVGGAPHGYEEAKTWLREAVQAKFNNDSIESLSQQDRGIAKQKADSVLIAMDETPGELGLREDLREFVAGLFAAKWDGIALNGPPWRLSPTDPADVPTFEEYLAAQKGEQDADEPVDAEGKPIPFGE